MSENIETKKPLLICLTPVRNEAWVLDAFLSATSLWADYIIIADQMSTDGSREIYKKYPKVIVVDNNDTELNENNRMNLLYTEARKIKGDKVFIALDADEIFTSNYSETADWHKITTAKPGDIFNFRWVWIGYDKNHCKYQTESWSQWAFYDDGTNPEEGTIHVARVPWPKKSMPKEFFVNDFFVMHLPYINQEREKSKKRYYQCFMKQNSQSTDRDLEKKWKNSTINFHRGYYPYKKEKFSELLPAYFTSKYLEQGIDIFNLLNLDEPFYWQDKQIIEYFEKYGVKYFQSLDIFDKEYLNKLSKIAGYPIKDPRNLFYKLLHFYLRRTDKYKNTFFVRMVDKLLKTINFE